MHQLATCALTRYKLEAELGEHDLELLDSEVLVASMFSKGAEENYLRRHGRHVASRLQAAGLYNQLKRRDDASGEISTGDIRRTLSLWRGIVNRSNPTCEQVSGSPTAFKIQVEQSGCLGESLRIANAGLLEGAFSHLADRGATIRLVDSRKESFEYHVSFAEAT